MARPPCAARIDASLRPLEDRGKPGASPGHCSDEVDGLGASALLQSESDAIVRIWDLYTTLWRVYLGPTTDGVEEVAIANRACIAACTFAVQVLGLGVAIHLVCAKPASKESVGPMDVVKRIERVNAHCEPSEQLERHESA